MVSAANGNGVAAVAANGANGAAGKGKLCVVGVGRLGVCVALCAEKAGYEVCGVDLNAKAVAQINARVMPSDEPGVTDMLAASSRLSATTDLAEGIKCASMVLITVDTPTCDEGYETRNLDAVLRSLNALKMSDVHVVVQCTVAPGYYTAKGSKSLPDCPGCDVSYSPLFVAQGDVMNGILRPDMVLVGAPTDGAAQALLSFYRAVQAERLAEKGPDSHILRVMSPPSAEIAKLAVNCFCTMKIAFTNLVGDLAKSTEGAQAQTILDAVGEDTRIGHKLTRYGWGFGGPCFTRDNRALAGYAERLNVPGLEPHVFRASDSCNNAHAEYQAQEMLAQTKGSTDPVVFEGICYKEGCDVPIVENSQKLVVASKLSAAGREVVLRDTRPLLDVCKEEWGDVFKYEEVNKTN